VCWIRTSKTQGSVVLIEGDIGNQQTAIEAGEILHVDGAAPAGRW
jgi:hypothetical protein